MCNTRNVSNIEVILINRNDYNYLKYNAIENWYNKENERRNHNISLYTNDVTGNS